MAIPREGPIVWPVRERRRTSPGPRLTGGPRLAVLSRRRARLQPLAALSLGLHLAGVLALVMLVPAPALLIGMPGPPAVEIVADASPAPAEKPPAPEAATPPAPAEVPPPPPVPQAQIPPPTPPPPPPDQTDVAALPPPPPAAAPPPPAPPPPRPAARPAARPPSRARAIPVAASHAMPGPDPASHGSGGSPDNGWIAKLKQWWDEHAVYPAEASEKNQGGDVKVHIVIAPDGAVTSINVVRSSGSSTLDMAALAVFRNAHLPPLAPGTPTPPGDVEVSLHYVPAGGG